MDIQSKLTTEGFEELRKMSDDGAKNASESLSKLIDQPVEVKTLAVRALPVERVTEIIGTPEEMVTTVVLGVEGDAEGSIMLIYPKQSAINVADFLTKRKLGSTTQLSELDKSALKESGNIIAGAFLSAISNYLKVSMVESIPDIATDMLKATMDFALTKFAEKNIGEATAFEVDFEMSTGAEEEKINAYFVLLLDSESASKVLVSLKKISGGKKMTE